MEKDWKKKTHGYLFFIELKEKHYSDHFYLEQGEKEQLSSMF